MAPFTPFLTEYMYQNLKFTLPEAEREDSVHYLSFPTEDESLIDEAMELAVTRMQTVIEMGRTARDRAKRPLKFPLREFIILQSDPKYHESLKPLEEFIVAELNVKKIVYSTDTSRMRRRIIPDMSVLGRRLRNEAPKVVKAIEALSEEQIAEFEKNGVMEVLGHTISKDEAKLVLEMKSNDSSDAYETIANDDVVIALSLAIDQELIDQGKSD